MVRIPMVDLSLQTLTHYLKLFLLPWSLEQLNGFDEHVIIDQRGKKELPPVLAENLRMISYLLTMKSFRNLQSTYVLLYKTLNR